MYDYDPNPVDMTNLTLSREMQNMAERLSENAHDIWARKKKEEMAASGQSTKLIPHFWHKLSDTNLLEYFKFYTDL